MFKLKQFFYDILFCIFFYLWLLFDFIKSKLISCHTYSRLVSRLKCLNFSKMHRILSIGFGDTYAFSGVFNKIPSNLKVTGNDSNTFKLFQCQKNENMEIMSQRLSEIENIPKFDAIMFTNSIFPFEKTEKQVQLAKKLLKINGKIFFIVSLFKKKTKFLKNCRHFLSNLWVNGSNAFMTEREFLAMLKRNKLDVNYKERIKDEMNPFFKFFRFFLIEVQI